MSQLDAPRLHFRGTFHADPNGGPDAGWNPLGSHAFVFRALITSGVRATGAPLQDPSADAALLGEIATRDWPHPAKIVDLKGTMSPVTELWGATVRLTTRADGAWVEAAMPHAAMRHLWMRRVPDLGPLSRASGLFQTVLERPTWGPDVDRSPALAELRSASRGRLSLCFCVYRYDAGRGPTWKTGTLYGTIGPAADDEPREYLFARRMYGSGSDVASLRFVLRADTAVLDLANALEESAEGVLRAGGGLALHSATSGARLSDPIDLDRDQLLAQGGLVSLRLGEGAALALASEPLELRAGGRVLLREQPICVEPEEMALRLEPGGTGSLSLRCLAFGRPAAGVLLDAMRLPFVEIGRPAPSDENGLVRLAITAKEKGSDLLRLTIADCGNAACLCPVVGVRVLEALRLPPAPTWRDFEPLLASYAAHSPWMARRLAIASPATYRDAGIRQLIRAALILPREHPHHMPVLRDLAQATRDALVGWLDAGAPGA